MGTLRRAWRHVVLGYQVRCAREDARVRNIVTPLGVWACAHCPHVSLSEGAFHAHLAGAHA